jgi:alpha-L-rhamnosidase
MRKQFVVCLAFFGVCAVRVPAQDLSKHIPWAAQWITAAGVPQRDEVVLHFRKIIELPSLPEHFVVQVSADNQFLFLVNGKRVGSGPTLSELGHWRYETYDLVPFLRAGRNVLAATVWNFGTHAAIAQMSDRVAFLVHGEGDLERSADTDATWDVEQEKAITTQRPNLPGFYYAAAPGERLDASKFDWDWQSDSNSDQSEWTKAVTQGRGALRWERDAPNNWQLISDPLPPMEMKEIQTGRVVRTTGMPSLDAETSAFPTTLTCAPDTKITILVDQGQLTTGYPALTVSGGGGSKIRLTYAEALYDDKGQKGNRNQIKGKHILGVADEFLPNGSSGREFMPLGWRTWRYLQIDVDTADKSLEIQGLRTWFSAYPFEEKAYFRSDDGSLQSIWQIGWRTARLDAHDTYMDTPYWERLQYIGDTRIQAMISYAVAGDDRLARQAIIAFNHSRIPDGLTQSRYPSSLVQMIPTFSLLWVGMVHDFWMYRGDPGFTKAQLPGVETVMDWFLARQRPDGLLGKIPWWPFVDWGKDFQDGEPPQDEDGQSAVLTLQFVEALRYAAELEQRYGDQHHAQTYREAAERASQAVWKLCWSPDYKLLADTPAQRHFSQHANILGVWLDVIPPAQQKAVMNELLLTSVEPDQRYQPKYHIQYDQYQAIPDMTLATYYFRYYLARALEHVGLGEWYLALLWPWREMVQLGLTTWAESPEPTRSDSHAWSAHPNFDLLTIVAGIHPQTPGFETVRIEPHLSGLAHLEAGMPTPRGMIEVKYTQASNGLDAVVNVPPNVSGELLARGQHIQLHGGTQTLHIPNAN